MRDFRACELPNIVGGKGELVRFVRPPVTGRSISIFDFDSFVRAGEAKLREREGGLLNARPWSCNFSSGSRALFASLLLLYAWVLSTFDQFCESRGLILLLFAWVLRP